ncbi:MAG: cell division protein FtsK, partial [Brevundimonas sp.]
AAWPAALLIGVFGLAGALGETLQFRLKATPARSLAATGCILLLSAALSALPHPQGWPLVSGLGGLWGDGLVGMIAGLAEALGLPAGRAIAGVLFGLGAIASGFYTLNLRLSDAGDAVAWAQGLRRPVAAPAPRQPRRAAAPPKAERAPRVRAEPEPIVPDDASPPWEEELAAPAPRAAQPAVAEPRVAAPKAPRTSKRAADDNQAAFDFVRPEGDFDLPPLGMLAKPETRQSMVDEHALKQNAKLLEEVLAEFGVRGVIDQIRPGPVVTLYELAPAPGVKHGRVVALSDDIARSMSARACRISVVQGRNAIGIELPNVKRETVYLRDLLASGEFDKQSHLLPLALGETIGGEPYVADLARMPHLLIAGTTGSGKSVGVNAMILSILYRHSPAECRFIMIDPKMLELSVYDGIPHLLA